MTRCIGRFQLVAFVLLLCVIIATPLVAAATESTASANINILEGKDRTYDLNDLVSGLHPIEVAVQNKGNSSVTFTAKIVTNLSDKSGNPVPLQFSTPDNQSLPAELSISIDEVKFLAFGLNQPDLEVSNLQPGLYRGFIALTNPANATIPFTLAVPSASLAPQGVASFAIKNPDPNTPLKVDYNALMKHHRIAVGIENTGKQAVNLTGTIILSNLVDEKGEPLQLDFVSENETGGVESVQVAQGQLGILYLNLTRPPEKVQYANESFSNLIKPEERKSPRTGNYTGYITVTAEREGLIKRAPLTLFVPSEDMAIQTISWPAAKEWMQGWFKQLSLQYLDHELEPSDAAIDAALTILIVLVIVVIILGIRKLRKRYIRSRPGPVTLNPITDATDDKLKTDGLNAYMKDQLENVDLIPPAGKPYENIVTVMEIVSAVVPGTPGKLGQAISGLLSRIFPPIGHKVTCTMRKDTETKPYALICEIVGEDTKETEKIDVVHGNTADEAVEEGAVLIYHYVVNEHKGVSQRVPPWARFSSAESLKMYQDGIKLEKASNESFKLYKESIKLGKAPDESEKLRQEALQSMRAAFEKYRDEAILDPNNIRVRLTIIRFQEGRQFLNTLLQYIRLVEQWPVLLEPRYRLAANLTFVNKLIEDCKKADEHQRKELAKLLQNSIDEGMGYVFDSLREYNQTKQDLHNTLDKLKDGNWIISQEELKKCFLILAKCQYEYLEEQSNPWRCLGKRLYLVRTNPDERRYYPYWKQRDEVKKFSKVVKLAKCCADLRILLCDINPNEEVSDIILNKVSSLNSTVKNVVPPSRMEPWEVHYNAACFFALALDLPETDKINHAICAKTAVAHLKLVIRDQRFTTRTWLFDRQNGDPDLEILRKQDEFTLWELIVNPSDARTKEFTQEELDNPDPSVLAA